MKIRAQLHAMAESEIAAMIPAEVLTRIKSQDKSPMIKAFVVGHEGEARGNLIGIGEIVKRWFKDMVTKLNEKISIGLQLFHGHAATNDTAGRIPIGEIVGNKLMEIKDRLSSVVACWIYPDYRHLPLDVASIEADIDLEGDDKDRLCVADVNKITGIALGNSEIETPGFPGATLLGQLQAFAEKKQRLQITLFEKGDKSMTLAELKQAIQESKLHPSDVFGQEAIFADPAIKEQVQEKIKNASGYNIRKLEDLTEEKVKLTKQLEEATAQIATSDQEKQALIVETAKTKVDSLFETQKKERGLDERQTNYIQSRLGKFIPQKPEELEKEFNTHLDNLLKDYKEDAKVFGVEVKTKPDPDKTGNGGTEPEGGKPEESGDKYLDPAQNPMIKAD